MDKKKKKLSFVFFRANYNIEAHELNNLESSRSL